MDRTEGGGSPTSVGLEGAQSAASPWWPYLLVGLAVLGVGVASWSPVVAGVWHDDGVYMLVGKALAEGHGLTYFGVTGSPPAAKYPPLYPALLGLLWLVPWGIGPVTLAATFLNLLFVAGAAALFARALEDNTGLAVRWCALIAVLAFVSTDLLRTSLVPLSESLFLFLSAAALALWRPAEESETPGPRLALAAVLATVVATRSAGLALVLAFALSLLLQGRPRRAAFLTGPALLTLGLWSWWSGAVTARIPEGTRDLLGPYGSWLADQSLTAPGAFLSRLPEHALGVFERVAVIAFPGLGGWPLLVAGLLALPLAGLGLVHMTRRFPPLAWLVPGYLAMLLLWPYLDRRLVVPVHPALLAVCALGAVVALERVGRHRSRILLLGLLVTWGAAYSVVTAARVARDWPVAPYRLRSERLATAIEALRRTAPPEAVVGAPEFWAAIHLHGGWTVAPSVRFDPRALDPDAPLWGTPEEQIELWRSNGVDHLLLEQAGTLHGAALDQLEAGCPGIVQTLAQFPPQAVVRIEWDRCSPPGG